ncbi:hypothetical protein COU19_03300 [Candidatus Kaiserbacteria bacterium CG10_big_fil_rev_8_21_14_0_10_56_12]|uniref:Uncharacterized protein n=1 Tax=Candidatus Kaiserbacteria bacterium CG10_big_fil_rev_8_21_14_0_10_56_12 TaxID=1974611 RepID=A0A2H0UB63_9BACT|nr:MAG: hypothetical protein COU19_03300 [Candidatus Kaiserbacteria bacterium CG10_big_fil_rev_8_21_14_0_10_56_12]
MDTNRSEDGHGHHNGVMCDACGHGHWGHVAVKVLIAIFIFWCGVQFGELKGALHGGYSSYGGSYGPAGMMNVRY